MKEFETIGTKLLFDDNGYTYRNAEVVMKIEFVGKELVRCKDCKHYTTLKGLWTDPSVCEVGMLFARPDDFCSKGERKDEVKE